jgi:hypothetical protein
MGNLLGGDDTATRDSSAASSSTATSAASTASSSSSSSAAAATAFSSSSSSSAAAASAGGKLPAGWELLYDDRGVVCYTHAESKTTQCVSCALSFDRLFCIQILRTKKMQSRRYEPPVSGIHESPKCEANKWKCVFKPGVAYCNSASFDDIWDVSAIAKYGESITAIERIDNNWLKIEVENVGFKFLPTKKEGAALFEIVPSAVSRSASEHFKASFLRDRVKSMGSSIGLNVTIDVLVMVAVVLV